MFLSKNSKAQNLIQNGSFESYTNIDCTYGGFINNYPPHNNVVDDWFGLSSPDYFNTVCPSSTTVYNAFSNGFGNISPHGGNAYCGFLTYLKGGEIKEYIYHQLSQPLQAGKIYCLNFFVSRVDRAHYSVANIGAYFSNTVSTLFNGIYVNKTPQIINQNGFITDTISWTEIQGCFTAIGGEQYITIGKFNTTGTDTLNSGTNNPIPFNPDFSYYYIDDITLIDQSTVGVNKLGNGATINVFPNPANDIVNFQFSDVNSKRKIVLYNTIGEVILTEDATTQNSSLKTHNLQSGVYFYTILVGDKNIKNDKIVIIR